MFDITDIGSLYRSLPPNLQTTENECLCYAVDRQMARFTRLAKRLTVWSDIDNADPGIYDQMAMTIRAPYYKSEYTDSVKRELIKSAVATRRFAGTRKAVELLLSKAYDESQFIPWYEYGDDPYYFKVITDQAMTQDIADLFAVALRETAAARSHIRTVEVHRKLQQTLYSGGSLSGYSRPAAIMDGYSESESVSGTFDAATGGAALSYTNNTVYDGYSESGSVSGNYEALTGAVINTVSKPPAIR